MYKLIAIDLDGTLLNSYGVITENTKKIIKKVEEQGVNIILASGRPIDSIQAIANEIESKKYFIAGNGAIVYDIEKDEIIYENCLKKQKVLEIIKICEENSIGYSIYTEKEILTTALKYNVLYYHKENLKKPEDKKTKISIIQNMEEYIKNDNTSRYLKITVCDEDKIVFDSIIRKLRNLKDIEVLDVSHMARKTIKQGTEEIAVEYYYTEISRKNVDKWNAIEFLAKKLEIDSKDIMAIGDNINDKQMIENAGLGVAMGQSTPVITNVANEVTSSNNEEGVAKILQKHYRNINF
ncbi:MAG: HAD family phosphatase [Clostridiales bacterium]|nr:HAD family phosphatase [Clostridiales bacterium]